MTEHADIARRFLDLHRTEKPLLLPNPWDLGSPRLLAWLGFKALATTSGGFAAYAALIDAHASCATPAPMAFSSAPGTASLTAPATRSLASRASASSSALRRTGKHSGWRWEFGEPVILRGRSSATQVAAPV